MRICSVSDRDTPRIPDIFCRAVTFLFLSSWKIWQCGSRGGGEGRRSLEWRVSCSFASGRGKERPTRGTVGDFYAAWSLLIKYIFNFKLKKLFGCPAITQSLRFLFVVGHRKVAASIG